MVLGSKCGSLIHPEPQLLELLQVGVLLALAQPVQLCVEARDLAAQQLLIALGVDVDGRAVADALGALGELQGADSLSTAQPAGAHRGDHDGLGVAAQRVLWGQA